MPSAGGQETSADAARPASPVRWPSIVAAAVLAVLFVRALVVPLFVWNLLHYPFDYFFSEGDMLFYTLRLVRGETIYSDSSAYPLLGNLYPPVYPWLTAFFAHVCDPTLISARAFAVIPLLLILLLIALHLRRAKVHPVLILASVLIVPCCYSQSQFLIMPRCDSWMAAFCLASFYFFDSTTAEPRTSLAALTLGGLFAALALFTKQTALPGLAAIQLTLLLRDPRHGLKALAATAVFTLLLLAVSLRQFGSPMIEALTGLTVRREFIPANFWRVYLPALLALAPLAAVAYGRVVADAIRRRWDLLDAFVAGHSIQTAFLVFKFSSANYFLTALPGLVIASAIVLQPLLEAHASPLPGPVWRQPKFRGMLGGCAIAAALLVLQLPHEIALTPPDKMEVSQMLSARDFLTGTDEPVYPEHFWGVVAERPATARYFSEPVHVFTLPPGRLPVERQIEPFVQKKFARVMLFEGTAFHPPELKDAVLQHYNFTGRGFLKVCFGETTGDVEVLFFMRKE